MKHVSLMHEAYISDAGFFRVGRTDGRTDGQAYSRSWISMILDPPSLTLMDIRMMHVCMMHTSVILDP